MTTFSIKNTFRGFLLLTLFNFAACKKFVDVDSPKTSLSSSALFTNDQGAVSAVAGLYSQMTQVNLNMMNGGTTVFAGLSADELTNPSINASYDPFKNNSLSSDNASISSRFWNVAYKTIYHANAVLEGLQTEGLISAPVKNQLRGEMLFVRAFHYFYLVNLFGDVPYITTTDYHINATLPRTPASSIYTAIVSDLTESKGLLQAAYPTNSKGRPNKWTATALLTRTYLYQNNWVDAESQATELINSTQYSLTNNLTNVFLPASSEIIWYLQRDNTNTAEGITFVPSTTTSKPLLTITSAMLNSFEVGDNRKIAWLQKNTVSGQAYYYPYKYKSRTSSPINEYLAVFRLAEIYLIRAEARAQQNKLTLSQSDINQVRSRAGLSNISATDQASLLSTVAHERQVELFAEWGHRWLDLKRTGKADVTLSTIKGINWQATDQLYPIPNVEIQKNSSLIQNPGY